MNLWHAQHNSFSVPIYTISFCFSFFVLNLFLLVFLNIYFITRTFAIHKSMPNDYNKKHENDNVLLENTCFSKISAHQTTLIQMSNFRLNTCVPNSKRSQ